MAKKMFGILFCAAVTVCGLQSDLVSVSGALQDDMALMQQANDAETEGLVREDGRYRYYENDKPVTDSWITTEEGTFYFDEDGMASVCSCRIGGTYYVFDEEGRLLQPSGAKIVKIEADDGTLRRFYVDEDGKAVSGWSDDKKYYFDKTGEMVTGIVVLKEKFYCFQAGGKYNKAKTQKIRKTAKYEKPFSNLKKYIGSPKKARYYASCYGKGRDGILTYENFIVYTFKPDSGIEIFMGAESGRSEE